MQSSSKAEFRSADSGDMTIPSSGVYCSCPPQNRVIAKTGNCISCGKKDFLSYYDGLPEKKS